MGIPRPQYAVPVSLARMGRSRQRIMFAGVCVAVSACSLLTGLDDFTGGQSSEEEAGEKDAADHLLEAAADSTFTSREDAATEDARTEGMMDAADDDGSADATHDVGSGEDASDAVAAKAVRTLTSDLVLVRRGEQTTATLTADAPLAACASAVTLTAVDPRAGLSVGGTGSVLTLIAAGSTTFGPGSLSLEAWCSGIRIGEGTINFLVAGAAGDLDPTFGTNGKLVMVGPSSGIGVMAIGAADKLVIAGGYRPDKSVVGRCSAQGNVDVTFGVQGFASFSLDAKFLEQGINDVAVQPDGRIVVVGVASIPNAYSQPFVARLLANGQLDDSFASQGIFTTRDRNVATATHVLLQSDGRILVGGTAYYGPDQALFRLNNDGSLDLGFGTGGMTIVLRTQRDVTGGVARGDDGRIYTTGYSRFEDGGSVFHIFGYTKDGLVDHAFGDDGGTLVSFLGSFDWGRAIQVLPDRRIVAAGLASDGDYYQKTDFALTRLHPDGGLDSTFGNGGKVVTVLNPGRESIEDIAIQKDGRMVAVGGVNTNPAQIVLARYLDNGQLDTSFGSNGKTSTLIGLRSGANSVAIDRYGRIVVGGTAAVNGDAGAQDFFAAARFWP